MTALSEHRNRAPEGGSTATLVAGAFLDALSLSQCSPALGRVRAWVTLVYWKVILSLHQCF